MGRPGCSPSMATDWNRPWQGHGPGRSIWMPGGSPVQPCQERRVRARAGSGHPLGPQWGSGYPAGPQGYLLPGTLGKLSWRLRCGQFIRRGYGNLRVSAPSAHPQGYCELFAGSQGYSCPALVWPRSKCTSRIVDTTAGGTEMQGQGTQGSRDTGGCRAAWAGGDGAVDITEGCGLFLLLQVSTGSCTVLL